MTTRTNAGIEILEADYHRNGVGGEGFYVGLIRDEGRRMLVTWFPEYEDDGNTLTPFQTRIAVVDVDAAATGNIYMYRRGDQPGGNAWRGDHYGTAARKIRDTVHARWDS